MTFYRLVFPIFVICVVQSYAAQVPVFMWGDLARPSQKSNPLKKMSVEDFEQIIKKEVENHPFTVVFIEETLSVEDFSRKDLYGETSFPYLHENIGNSLYLPSVTNPLHVLNKIADPEKVDHVKLTENGLTAEIEPEGGKFLFINLRDAREGESRADMLRRHNQFMEETFTNMVHYNKVLAVYTAHYASWTIPESHSRTRRQTEAQSNGDYALNALRLYVHHILLIEDGKTVDLGDITGNSTTVNGTEMSSTLDFNEHSLTLNFVSHGGYWMFKTVTLKQQSNLEELQASSDVYAPLGFSYRCAQNVVFFHPNSTVKIMVVFQDLKIQPFFENGNSTKFGDSINCQGFFSVPIWSGLFVVFIMLAITFYGIMMMMDIRTMDRFDDPKGKTITISATD